MGDGMIGIQVGKSGRYYTLNGEIVKPFDFYGINGFKFANHVWGWITAGKGTDVGGGVHLSNAKRYIEREVIGNGCRRMRAPIELLLWTGPYFDANDPRLGDQQAPNIANTLALMNLRAGTGSGFSLTSGMRKLIRMYVVLAREFEVIIEIPVLWTIKSTASGEAAERLGFTATPPDPRIRFDTGTRSGVAIWNEHVLAAHGVGAYLRELETVGGGERIHRVDPGGLNLIVDAMNEYTAHVPEIWTNSVLESVARRWNEREKPGVPLLISQSGRADRYAPPLESKRGASGFLGPCLHPPRDGEWAKTGNVMRDTWPNELIDVNESQLGWTEEERAFWTPIVPKWAGLGSTDMGTWRRMHENFIGNEIYTTFHTKRSMDAGWPDSQQGRVEETIRLITGVSSPAPPPPDPPPMPPTDELKLVTGRNFASIQLREPVVVNVEEDGDAPFVATYYVTLPKTLTVTSVDSFRGMDRGDAFESALEVFSDDDAAKIEHPRDFLWRRIDEDTAPGSAGSLLDPIEDIKVRVLRISWTCRVTGSNDVVEPGHPSHQEWRGVFGFNLMLVGRWA